MSTTSEIPPPTTTAPTGPVRTRLTGLNVGRLRDYGVVVFLVALCTFLSFGTNTFLTVNNLTNLAEASVVTGLLALGGALVLMAGGFDLSSGAVFSVGAVVTALACNAYGTPAGVALGLLVGTGLGLVNGLLCTVGGINAFVGTLGTSIAFQGLAVMLSHSGQVAIDDQGFGKLALTDFLGLSTATWIFIVVTIGFAILLNRTVFGRHIRGAGGNPEAARLSGVPVHRTVAITFVLSGFVAALAGVLTASSSLVVSPNIGSSIVFDALAAILIGGNSMFGGGGSIWRVIAGVAILSIISNGFNLYSVDPIYEQFVTGGLIVIAIGADAWTRRTS